MLIVDRLEFMTWINGTLLDHRNGVIIAPDELLCERVEDSAQRGEPVGFTVDGRLCSIAQLNADGVIEERRV